MMTDSTVSGATPLALALESVKATLDAKKAADSYKNCRQRFAILLSDGADTMYCGSAVNDTDRTQYKRRRASVARAKALADAGYQGFCHRLWQHHAPLPKKHPELDGLLRRHRQPA